MSCHGLSSRFFLENKKKVRPNFGAPKIFEAQFWLNLVFDSDDEFITSKFLKNGPVLGPAMQV